MDNPGEGVLVLRIRCSFLRMQKGVRAKLQCRAKVEFRHRTIVKEQNRVQLLAQSVELKIFSISRDWK